MTASRTPSAGVSATHTSRRGAHRAPHVLSTAWWVVFVVLMAAVLLVFI